MGFYCSLDAGGEGLFICRQGGAQLHFYLNWGLGPFSFSFSFSSPSVGIKSSRPIPLFLQTLLAPVIQTPVIQPCCIQLSSAFHPRSIPVRQGRTVITAGLQQAWSREHFTYQLDGVIIAHIPFVVSNQVPKLALEAAASSRELELAHPIS